MTSKVEDRVSNLDPNIVDDFDLDVLFLSDIPTVDLDPDLLLEPGPPESVLSHDVALQSSGPHTPVPSEGDDLPPPVSASPDSVSSFVNYIEKFLMEDVDWSGVGEGMGEDCGEADFFSGIGLPGLDRPNSDVENPQLCDAVTMEGQSKEEKAAVLGGIKEDDGDFISKKRRRQMRNRESAMISRERKKMYIKDLEMKSKHLYSESCRLEYALRCCTKENMELRKNLQLQRNMPWVAFGAKHESAVLFVESLLLGSLFWLMSLVCLFLAPGLRNLEPDQKAASRSGRDIAMVGTVSEDSVELGRDLKLRGMRGRMKFFSSHPPAAVNA